MYCGDETGAFIGEIASHTSRFGYGGDDCPKSVFASHMYHDGTVPTTTHRFPPQSPPQPTPSSSTPPLQGGGGGIDHPDRWMEEKDGGAILQDVIPIYDRSFYGDDHIHNKSLLGKGVCDPDQYLFNDGIVQNWDAWENAWMKSFDDLAVRRYGKHTGGTTVVDTSRKNDRRMGMRGVIGTVSVGKRSRGMFDGSEDSNGLNEDVVSSTTLVGTDRSEGHDLMHPLLAIHPGYTHFHLPPPSSSPTSPSSSPSTTTNTGPNYQKALHRQQKTTMTELLFESLRAPATFLAPAPMLASFASGRQTSLVVDIGAAGCRVTPVVDGLLLENAQRRSGRGGEWLGRVQRNAVERLLFQPLRPNEGEGERLSSNHKSVEGTNSGGNTAGFDQLVHPRYALSRPNGQIKVAYPPYTNVQRSIFHHLAVADVMYEMRTGPHISGVAIYREQDWTVPFVDESSDEDGMGGDDVTAATTNAAVASGRTADDASSASEGDYDDSSSSSGGNYVLPDGTTINLRKTRAGRDLRRIPELLFSDEIPFSPTVPSSSASSGSALTKQTAGGDNVLTTTPHTFSSLPVHDLVHASLTAVPDADLRKELCGNIVLCGASSLFTNLERRLSLEVSHIVPTAYRCKIIASRSTMERRYAAWIGGSILSSLGSFQQLWLSRREYEEYGAVLALQRFP